MRWSAQRGCAYRSLGRSEREEVEKDLPVVGRCALVEDGRGERRQERAVVEVGSGRCVDRP